MTGRRLAVNPISYWLKGGRTVATLGAAFEELSAIGYTAVKADVPTDLDAASYVGWLAGFGLEPALSLFPGSWADASRHAEVARAAGEYAAVQASLGMSVCMVSTTEPRDHARQVHPAVGADFDAGRLATVVEGIGATCEAMRAEGVRAALHPHVGGWVETEQEVRAVLDGVGPELLAFGPDTGHLAWAGADVPGLLRDYSSRIVGCHLKDVFGAGVERAKREDLSYQDATLPGRLWAEPGTGSVDLDACVAAFPDDYDGDFMIEVDVPSVPDRECHEIAYRWAVEHLPLGEVARR